MPGFCGAPNGFKDTKYTAEAIEVEEKEGVLPHHQQTNRQINRLHSF